MQLGPVDETSLAGLARQEDVLGDAQVGNQIKFLMNYRDARALGVARRSESLRLALEDHPAFIGLQLSAHHLHESRLARAVLAAERMDLAALHLEAHVGQRIDAEVTLGDAFELQQRRLQRVGARLRRMSTSVRETDLQT